MRARIEEFTHKLKTRRRLESAPGVQLTPGAAFLAYILIVFVGAALVAPWVAHAISGIANIPFRRVVDRCLLFFAIIGIWPLVKVLGFRSWADIGVRKNRQILREYFSGALMGSVFVAVVAGCSLFFGGSRFEPARSDWHKHLANALAPALIVPVLEEILFRGAIFTALRRTWNNTAALWVSSSVYAILHFFARPQDPPIIQWDSGLNVLGSMLRGFTEVHAVIPGFFSLTLLGVIFALAFQRTGALWLSMGIHAGLIFWVKIFTSAANPNPQANLWFWGTEKWIDGWFGFVLIAAAATWFGRRKP